MMRKNCKKAIALALVLCSVLGLLVPMTNKASAATYTLPEYMSYQELGIVLKGNPNLPGQVEIAEMNGRQYIGVPIKGAEFYVFDLTACVEGKKNKDGNYIYAKMDSGVGIPRGIALDSKGTFYVTGDSKSVFWYNIKTGKSGQISTSSSGLTTVAVDEKDNVYAVGKVSGGGGVFKLNTTNGTSQLIYETSDFTTIQGVAAAEGRVYALGAVKNDLGGGAEVRMLNDQGKVLSNYAARGSTASYYLTWLDGVLFVGANSASTDGLLALDTKGDVLSRIGIGMDAPINGFVTKPYNGKAYMALHGQGIFEYDVANRRIGQKVNGTGHRELRCRNFIEHEGNVCMISVGPSSITRTGIGVGYISDGLGGLLDGAGSTFSARSMVSGVAGTGVAVYVGAYLSGSVGSYSPNAATPMTGSVFSNGHAQTDSMLQYKGKIYGGIYSGAYLIQYDPATNEVTELIPDGLYNSYSQLRIHALAAGDNKIFFGTIPGDQLLGGCIGWYDLSTGETYVERNVVKDQAIIALTYDESKDILYIGTTIRGGTNTTATAEQAVVAAYDVKAKKVLATAKVDSLTGNKPKNISGLARDPDTGKIWGVVAQTVFSLKYEGGKLKVTKEWAAPTVPGDPYPDGGSRSWFPRNILFDGKGSMYIGMLENKYGTMRFALDADNKIQSATTVVKNTSRIYSMGSDGNLYLYGDQLYKVVLPDRAGIVKNLIDSAKASSKDSVEQARSAYDALSAKEQSLLGASYLQKLITLEEGEVSPEIDVIIAIEDIGAVTLNSAAKIQAARNLYNKLTTAQKAKVTNYQTLVNAEKAYEALVEEQNNPTTKPTEPTVPPTTTPEESVPAVDPVEETINAIKAIGRVTPASGAAISNARATYDSLTAAQKKKVTNYQTLLDAEAAFEKLVPDETEPEETTPEETTPEETTPDDHPNASPAEDVIDAISAIGAVNQQSGKVIKAARQMYEELTAQEKALVINYQTLVDAEKLYEALMNQEETPDETEPEETTPGETTPEETTPEGTTPEGTTPDETIPEGTDEPVLDVPTIPSDDEQLDTAVIVAQVQINAIGEVTLGSGPVIQAARESYDALTPAQQAQVNNAQALFDAEAAFAALSQKPSVPEEEKGDSTLVYILIAVGAVVVAAVIVVVVLTKKKKAPVADAAPAENPETTEE